MKVLFGLLAGVTSARLYGSSEWWDESRVENSLGCIRATPRPFFRRRPSKLLTLATAFTSAVTFLVPHLPFASLLGFGLMPAHLYLVILLIVIAYMAAAEITKRVSYRVAREAAPQRSAADY
jgi:Mg2+-importing ATPase